MADITEGITMYEQDQFTYRHVAEIFARGPKNKVLRKKIAETASILVSSKCIYNKGPNWSLHDDWDDPTVLELEHLLKQFIKLAFQGAKKEVVENGYTEEVAERAILKCRSLVGMEDLEHIIVLASMTVLKDYERFVKDKPHVDDNLENIVSYSVLENVAVLREIMPGISIAEAIWNLLICDNNLMLLCAAKEVFVNKNYCPSIEICDVSFEQTGESSSDCRKADWISIRDILKLKSNVLRRDKKSRERRSKVNICEENVAKLEDSSKNFEDRDPVIPHKESSPDERCNVLMFLWEKIKELVKEKEDWTKWANEKVMQVAERLGRDQKELQQLRAYKEEAENVKSSKSLKRMIEVADVLSFTQANVDEINTLNTKLKEETSNLKKIVHDKMIEFEAASEEFKKSDQNEQNLLKRLQEEEKINNSLTQELIKLRARRESIESDVSKGKARLKQQKAREMQISKDIEQIMKSTESIRSEREQIICEANKEQEAVKMSVKYKEEIQRLEAQISQLKIGDVAVKAQKRLPVFEDMYEEMTENECVMCLNEEKSVVFLPCSHQVVCVKCSEQHEKQGMKECPTCRTTITHRIQAIFIN